MDYKTKQSKLLSEQNQNLNQTGGGNYKCEPNNYFNKSTFVNIFFS